MPIEMEFPFWDMIINAAVPVVDKRQLHHLTRGIYQAAERLKADIRQMGQVSVYWCGHRPVTVLSSPVNRIDLEKLQNWFGVIVRPATATEVAALCGTHVNGIPPTGLAYQMPLFIDDELLKNPAIWVSAGDPAIWVALTPENLVRVTGGYVMHLKMEPHLYVVNKTASHADKSR